MNDRYISCGKEVLRPGNRHMADCERAEDAKTIAELLNLAVLFAAMGPSACGTLGDIGTRL